MRVVTANPTMTGLLFDSGVRTYRGYETRSGSDFSFLNRSAWGCVEAIRSAIESWYDDLPMEKKKDIRNRFRSEDDRQHQGACLEVTTHRILHTVGEAVQGGPELPEGNPDFAASFGNVQIIVECTVAQESEEDVSATRRLNTIKAAIDSLDTGRFYLWWELLEGPTAQPPVRRLKGAILDWLSSLDPGGETRRLEQFGQLQRLTWDRDGWKVQLEAVPASSRRLERQDARAIGVDGGQREIRDADRIRRALDRKAEKYRSVNTPYLVVVGSEGVMADRVDTFDPLLGKECIVYRQRQDEDTPSRLSRMFDGIFGSPSNPKNQHVSGVLYKPWPNPFNLCGPEAPWQLVHHPWADAPLGRGLFPFAVEWVLESGGFARLEPTRTLNDALGLPDPWPGRER